MLSPAVRTRRSTSSTLHLSPRAKEETRAIGKEEHGIPKQKVMNDYSTPSLNWLPHNLKAKKQKNNARYKQTFTLPLAPVDVCQCQTETTLNIPVIRKKKLKKKYKGTKCCSSFREHRDSLARGGRCKQAQNKVGNKRSFEQCTNCVTPACNQTRWSLRGRSSGKQTEMRLRAQGKGARGALHETSSLSPVEVAPAAVLLECHVRRSS